MISTRVAGGAPAAPSHSIFPVPQSPVSHLKEPDEPPEQPVRAQNLPDQPGGAAMLTGTSCRSSNPVRDRGGLPALARLAAHIVVLQLFTNLKEFA